MMRSHKTSRYIPIATAMIAALLAAGGRSAFAFTEADANTAVDAYLKAFVQPKGEGSFIKGDQNGGDPGFWQEIEEIEGIEDANDRTHGAYNAQVTALLNGFTPPDDIEASSAYRRRVAPVLAQRALRDAMANAQGEKAA